MRGIRDAVNLSQLVASWRSGRAVAVDLVLWVVLSVPTAVGVVVSHPGQLWLTVPGSLLPIALLIALSRMQPLASVCLSLVLEFAWAPEFVYATPVLTFLCGRRMARAKPALIVLVGVAVAGTIATPLLGIPLAEWLNGMLILVAVWVFPWLAGRSWRQYQELVHAGWERAEQLEREQRIVEAQARLRERARIASDMHDSLGHELSLLALRAGALEMADDLPERHRRAAQDLRAGVADSTERLREIIGLFRERDGHAPTEPASESVTDMVERATVSGLSVELQQDGEHATLPPLIDRAVYRVVQESLTNAAKHAPGVPVTVTLTHTARECVVQVRNELVAGATETGSGQRGLAGLTERVRLLGGTLRAGPGPAGFEVIARIPLTATDVRPQPLPDVEGQDETESARHLAHAQRRVRRSLVAAVVVPGAVFVLLAVATTAQYSYNSYTSTLRGDDFAALHVGQRQASVERALPPRQYTERPTVVEPTKPAGASCRYYRAQRNPFNLPSDAYRLCFRDGRLVAKDVIDDDAPAPQASRTP